MAVLLVSGIARSDGVVLESFTGSRPESATELLAPIHDELNLRGYVSNGLAARRYESRASRPVAEGLPSTFEPDVEAGHKAWVAGRFDDAIASLTSLVAVAHASPPAIAKSSALRTKLFKAMVALALSQARRSDTAAASTFKEMLRSFPDMPIPKASYGVEAFTLYEDAKRAAARDGRGTLTVRVPDTASAFINERSERLGTVTQTDLIPGTYRVFAQLADGSVSRVYRVEVKRDEEAVLAIEPAFDASLQTSATRAGLIFESAAERERSEVRFAARFATESGSSSVIVIGIDQVRGRPAIVGSLIDIAGVRETRRASIAVEPTPSEERLRALARFLAGDKATEGLDVELGAETKDAPTSVGGPPSRRWMLVAGIAAVVVGGAAGGGLAVKYHFDSKDIGDEILRVCASSCTPDQVQTLEAKQNAARRNRLISGVAGGAVVMTGLVFIVLSQLGGRDDGDRAVSISPTADGALGTFSVGF